MWFHSYQLSLIIRSVIVICSVFTFQIPIIKARFMTFLIINIVCCSFCWRNNFLALRELTTYNYPLLLDRFYLNSVSQHCHPAIVSGIFQRSSLSDFATPFCLSSCSPFFILSCTIKKSPYFPECDIVLFSAFVSSS